MTYLIAVLFAGILIVDNSQTQIIQDTLKYPVKASDLLVIIRNNLDEGSIQDAKKLKNNLVKQSRESNDYVVVKTLDEDWAPYGAWTILTIVRDIAANYKDKKWVFICETSTEVDLKAVLAILSRHNYDESFFLGHALTDREPSIIHHFKNIDNLNGFKFPDIDAGFVVSRALWKHASDRLHLETKEGSSIDVKYEVAEYFFEKCGGVRLTHVPAFCLNRPLQLGICATSVKYKEPDCGYVKEDKIMIAVKTCEKFHKERVPVVQKTVGLYVKHIIYYSDAVDKSIPTIYAGTPNTERGHCQKTRNILKDYLKKSKNIEWLVIMDDDTIMSYKRLQKILACYDASKIYIIGERYGYRVNQDTHGFDYPTGGSGMIFSRPAVIRFISSNFKCNTNNELDDMWIGYVARKLNIPIVHSNSLHKTRPSQYNKDFLSHRYLVSFHNHHLVDPWEVYTKYLHDEHEILGEPVKVEL